MFLAIEFCLVVVCLALAFSCPNVGDRWFSAAERRLSVIAQRRTLTVVCVGLLALGIRLALLPFLPIPQPEVTDEYSYLLSGDTFAHGRLTNPTHPMWIHLETFQENWRPTYGSMYYPSQGLFQAFGQVVMGHPFWGVWLSCGLMCAAICWALQGWMPPGWALVGALLALIRLATFSYWADSYWGGSVAALGGALAIGALPRIKEIQRVRDSLLMALGMALMLYSRPYEGFFFSLPLIAALIWAAKSRGKQGLGTWLERVAFPIALVMAIAFAALGYYFWRVTGSPFTTPYQINMRTYGLVYFPWDKLKPVEFHHEFMRQFYRGASVVGWQTFALQHQVRLQFLKALVIWLFYFGPLLSLPWIAWLLKRMRVNFKKSFTPELRLLLAVCAATYFSCMLTIYLGQPHYIAPLAAVFYIAMLLMMRDAYGSEPIVSSGRFLARSIPVLVLLLFVMRVAAPIAGATPKPSFIRTWCSQDKQNMSRAHILSQLEQMPGEQLAIVRYRPDHDFILDEWVFNGADIDGSKVIWARDMGSENEELLRYFKTRHVWLVEPDDNPPRLTPYVH